jgi:hypothetical protein
MNEHHSCVILQFPNASFRHSILPVSIDTTKAECLLAFGHCLAEQVVSEDAIVCMVVFDVVDTMSSCKLLKPELGFHCLFSTC